MCRPAPCEGLAFVPELHANYAVHVLRMADGLPKFVGFPAEFGGTGETDARIALLALRSACARQAATNKRGVVRGNNGRDS